MRKAASCSPVRLQIRAGSLIVIEVDSLEDAQRFAREDPYTVNGVFERVDVHPFIQVFPKER